LLDVADGSQDVESLAAMGAAHFVVGGKRCGVSEIVGLARGELIPVLNQDPGFRAKISASRETFKKAIAEGRVVYGVTTGVGASVRNAIPPELRAEMARNLFRFHGCGTGRSLDEEEAGAVVAARLITLSLGHSGVREIVLERLCDLLEHRVLPCIPAEGSVGASGDLTPLSYLAATLAGEREVMFRGRVRPADEALREAGIAPLILEEKESLSVMNGTSAMTALACLAVDRARRLSRLSAAITALAVDVTHGNRSHYDARIFRLKPHPGQALCAEWIREALEYDPETPGPTPARLQDRYSLRCAPHIIGVLVDSLIHAESTLEIEINGVDDNPLIDSESGDILHCGNFYGGHVCAVMDTVKTAVANIADLLDRQLMLLCSPETSDGLPADLVAKRAGANGSSVDHHGFKAMQITSSALAAEALKLTIPASAFSRSTESHNQDKVSMGTIAARDCLRILELSETVAAIALLAGCQAADLRGDDCRLKSSLALRDAVRKAVPTLKADRRQDLDIEKVLELQRSCALPIGEHNAPR